MLLTQKRVYPAFIWFIAAGVGAYLFYILAAAAFYTNVLLVCDAERLLALIFSVGVAIPVAIAVYTGGVNARVDEAGYRFYGRNGKLCATYAAADLIRAERRVTLISRVFRAVKITLVFQSQRFTLYVSESAALAGELQILAGGDENAQQIQPFGAGMFSLAVRLFLMGAAWIVALLPAVLGIFHANGVRLNSLGGGSFFVRGLLLFVICLATAAAFSALVALVRAVRVYLFDCRYSLAVRQGFVVRRKGYAVCRTTMIRGERLRLVQTRRYRLSCAKEGAVTLVFNEGARSYHMVLGGQNLPMEQVKELCATFAPDYAITDSPILSTGECGRFYYRRRKALFIAETAALAVGALFFAFLESWLVLWTAACVWAFLWLWHRTATFATDGQIIAVCRGVLVEKCGSVRTEHVVGIRLIAGVLKRTQGRWDAKILVGGTESNLVLDFLDKNEAEKAAKLVNLPQK